MVGWGLFWNSSGQIWSLLFLNKDWAWQKSMNHGPVHEAIARRKRNACHILNGNGLTRSSARPLCAPGQLWWSPVAITENQGALDPFPDPHLKAAFHFSRLDLPQKCSWSLSGGLQPNRSFSVYESWGTQALPPHSSSFSQPLWTGPVLHACPRYFLPYTVAMAEFGSHGGWGWVHRANKAVCPCRLVSELIMSQTEMEAVTWHCIRATWTT